VIPTLLLATLVAASPADPVMERLQAVYDRTADLHADFTQVYTFKVNGLRRKSSGSVWIKKPGKMRWDYAKPHAKYFVSDGSTLWVYQPAEGQVFIEPLGQSQAASALSFLLGHGRLTETFEAKLLPPGKGGEPRLELVPIRHAGHFRKVTLTLDADTYRVVSTEVEDPVGNLNRITLSSVQVNKGLPDKGFTFTPPAGVRVIRSARPEGSGKP
jgi:outer membrane lipoprotein carrier protein